MAMPPVLCPGHARGRDVLLLARYRHRAARHGRHAPRLAFDNFFWLELVPSEYAALQALEPAEGRRHVFARYAGVTGSLAWYSVDYWARELGLDIRALKRRHSHLISYLPGARRFLSELRALEKRVVVVTNAHPATLAIKIEETDLHA